MDFYRGRLIDHVHLVVRDLEASRKFYEAVLGVIGVDVVSVGDDFFWADELFVGTGEPNTGRIHLAFQAVDHDMVHRFHAAGLKAGGRDNGAPGERKYHPGYYAAFLLDPDGNNIEAVHHGPAKRSADAVVVTAEM
jgi:catechol 2,3-dioxygenase-like lactoylglutathione lyase family enzyme